MDLYLMRHGIAEDLGAGGNSRDSERPLTARGAERVRQIAAALQSMELHFDHVLASPFLRARQTAEIVAEVLGRTRALELSTPLAIPPDNTQLLKRLQGLRPAPDAVLLVGHEPHLSELTSLLVTGAVGCGFTFKKGGLAKLSAEALKAGRCATLEWLLAPKQLLRMS